jgi:hypothetical protein
MVMCPDLRWEIAARKSAEWRKNVESHNESSVSY